MPDIDKLFTQQVVHLSDLVRGRRHGGDILQGYIFNDCQLIGPAVLLPQTDTYFNECDFDHPEIFIPVLEDRLYFGMIALRNCTLEKCRFERIGIAAPQEMIDGFLGEHGNPQT